MTELRIFIKAKTEATQQILEHQKTCILSHKPF